MSQQVALVTGAEGEMGHLLIPALKDRGYGVVALDLAPLDSALRKQCIETTEASILDRDVLRGLVERHAPGFVFHLAAVLSAKAERDPDLAHPRHALEPTESARRPRARALDGRRVADLRAGGGQEGLPE